MNWIQCQDLSESGFPVLWILCLDIVCDYTRVDFLYCGHCLHLDIVCGSNQMVDLLHFGYCPYLGVDSIVVKSLYISVYRHLVLLDTERITG